LEFIQDSENNKTKAPKQDSQIGFGYLCLSLKTKEVIRIRKSKKDRQHNGSKKDRQHNGSKKDRQHNGSKKDRQHNGSKKDRHYIWPIEKVQTMIYKTLHRKLMIEQHEPH
jgi:ABC-type Zn2+ transport system substrate-binding protein/surface adhesin